MSEWQFTVRDGLKAAGVGVAVALLLSAVMVPAFKLGISPLPEPLGLAFAERALGRALPLPVGLLFHVAYVTFWSMVYVALLRGRHTFVNALGLAVLLWLLVLVLFFPLVGWGFLGLDVGARLIPASLAPHLLFAVLLWALTRWVFGPAPGVTRASSPTAGPD